MADIPDLIFTVDENGNVVYPNGGGYTSGNGSATGGYSNTTGKKWWEVALGVFPALLSSIFGNNQQPTTNYPYPTQGTSNTGTFGSMNMVLIIVVVALAVFLLMKKK